MSPESGWGSSPPTPIFRYTGQAALSAVGLYYYKARIYDPKLGRFLQTDPLGYSAGMNLYAYVGNDPANNGDPLGLLGYRQTCYYSGGTDSEGNTVQNTLNGPCDIDCGGDAALLFGSFGSDDVNPFGFNATAGNGGSSGNGTNPVPPGCNSTNVNGSLINRARFFTHLPELRNIAQALNVPEDYIVGLSSYESGWLDNHNAGLNNLWGLTKAGGNNINFSSFAAGNSYFSGHVGPYIQGSTSIAAFEQGLQNEGYNSVNPNYWSTLTGRINSIRGWEARCGVQ